MPIIDSLFYLQKLQIPTYLWRTTFVNGTSDCWNKREAPSSL